jgi:hypothetical protein
MRIMDQASQPKIRRDGWTQERRQRFLGVLAAGIDVRRACAHVGLSRRAAYNLRRREPAFARAWDEALRSARRADEEAFLAMLPERLRRTLSGLSGECELHGGGRATQDGVRVVAHV